MSSNEQLFQGIDIRTEVARAVPSPPPDVANKMLEVGFSPFEHDVLEIMKTPGHMLEHLRILEGVLKNKGEKKVSRPALCSLYIQRIITPLQILQAEEALKAGYLPLYTLSYDIAFGLGTTAATITSAETAIEKGSDQTAADFISAVEDYNEEALPTDQLVQIYLRLNNEITDLSRLLREDPTGFLLIDTYIRKVESVFTKGEHTHTYEIAVPEFFLAGARLTQKIYTTAYPISESI